MFVLVKKYHASWLYNIISAVCCTASKFEISSLLTRRAIKHVAYKQQNWNNGVYVEKDVHDHIHFALLGSLTSLKLESRIQKNVCKFVQLL